MSQSKPQVDITYLNNFLSKVGKKPTINRDFSRAKLLNIINKMAANDPIQAQIARAHTEAYFGNIQNCVNTLEDVLKKTNYKYLHAWDMLMDSYVQSGDLENILSTFQRIMREDLDNQGKYQLLFMHVVRVYLLTEVIENIRFENSGIQKDFIEIASNSKKLIELGISVEIYRRFMSKIYSLFYTHFSGTIQPVLFFNDCELVIRVNSTVDDAEDLFELNNKFKDEVFNWYEKAIDNSEQEQIEKITVYFKHKTFNFEAEEASA
jgi:pentatricopeptide repeat protein